jgi:hypothetical protein
MTALLLNTKLHIPPVRPKLILRPCFIERLNAGLHRKLIRTHPTLPLSRLRVADLRFTADEKAISEDTHEGNCLH